jgi:1-acyl-sn-glycerol-3-phosphate acyltransferase
MRLSYGRLSGFSILLQLNSMSRSREPLINLVFYHAFKQTLINPFFYLYLRGKVIGTEHIPKTGGFVVVCNHGSNFDPPLLSAAVLRPVAYMAKEELFEVPVLKQAIALYGAYPVKRGAVDRTTIRTALAYLDEGWGAGIFLSGTRTPDGKVANPQPGAALIAAKAQVPMLPVCLWGTHSIEQKGKKLPQATPVTVRIGELIEPPTSTKRSELDRVTDICTTTINELHDLGR